MSTSTSVLIGKICPNCKLMYSTKRPNQKFCSARCRKNESQKRRRAISPVNSANSVTKRRDNMLLFDRAIILGHELYMRPPGQRLGYMKSLIDEARAGNSALRQLLSNQYLLRPPLSKRWLFHNKSPAAYFTIAQAADRYCRKFWQSGVKKVVYGVAPEPPTGEVKSVVTIY